MHSGDERNAGRRDLLVAAVFDIGSAGTTARSRCSLPTRRNDRLIVSEGTERLLGSC
jgi:hypothetical protein